VTTTLSVKGQVVIPQPLRATHKLRPGTDFTILTRSNGDIILRPVKGRRHHPTLAENLLALSGLPIDPEQTHSRDLEL
jgi:AbrB family looped-hinge helix DNA binding protein